MNLNNDNIELYLFRYKEGLLDAAESAEVEHALKEHPEWQELADLYDPGFKLPAGATMPYADFESLRDGGPKVSRTPVKISLRDEEPRRRRALPLWTTVAAAACMLLFVTSIIKMVNNEGHSGGPVVAELTIEDSTPGRNVESCVANDEIVDMTIDEASRSISNDESLFLADAVNSAAETPVEQPNRKAGKEPLIASDSNVYQLDNPTLREINDPMDQEVLYANIIDWQKGNPESPETPSHRQPLRNIARKATSIIATAASGYEEKRENVEDAIEERIQSNQFVSSLIATLE
jgi:hypothetical protein